MEGGNLNLILGCMFSGKTSELLNRYNRYNIANKKCLLVKYEDDIRYDDDCVVTHNNIKIPATKALKLCAIDEISKNYDVICIDEIQFFDDAHIFCDLWANKGKIVEVCGLNGTFERQPFEIISKLIPLCDNITYMKAICIKHGTDAIFSRRKINNTNTVVIGGNNIYSAADRKEYFEYYDYDYYLYEQFLNFAELICDKEYVYDIIGSNIDNIMLDLNAEKSFMNIIKKLNIPIL